MMQIYTERKRSLNRGKKENDHGKSLKNHGISVLKTGGNPALASA